MLASSVLWQHLRSPQPFEWQRSHLFFIFDSNCVREDLMCHTVRACARARVNECAWVQEQLEICCWTTALDLLANYLNSGASCERLRVCESQFLMSSFHAVLRSFTRWRCRFTLLLLQISAFECMCRDKASNRRWGICNEKGSIPLRGRKQAISHQ